MALEPEEYEFGFPTFMREIELLEETSESSFEKGDVFDRKSCRSRAMEHALATGVTDVSLFSSQPLESKALRKKNIDRFFRTLRNSAMNRSARSETDVLSLSHSKIGSSWADFWDKDATDVLDQMENVEIAKLKSGEILKRKCKLGRMASFRMMVQLPWESRGEREERIRDEIAMVKSDFEKVRIMLNFFNPKILNNQVAEPGSSSPRFPVLFESIKERQPYQKAKSEIPNRLRYCKDEIKTTAELLEKMFLEIDENVGFTKSSGYEKLREFNHSLLDHIEKCDIESIAKIAESSVAKVEPQSKGVVSKKNALRRQHNSQRDDPDEELSRDQVEMKTTLVECVFRIPQQPRFITALGYTPILVA